MCGIAGIFSLQRQPDSADVLRMMDKLHHRGPDDQGLYCNDNVSLGFKRLSFIDLQQGNQPLFNEQEDIICVVNGEIFNYVDLRKELISRGHQFRSHTDCEVIPHLYEEYGLDFPNKLNGQYAIALYDRRLEKLILVRDQVGIAPLFYFEKNGELLFASEIKALLTYPTVDRTLDLISLDQIVTFPGMVSPRTMFKEIHALPPGHLMTIDRQGQQLHQYWDLDYPTNESAPFQHEAYYIEQLDELLHQAIHYRLHADVPIGFYLSGGLDSSLLAAMARQAMPNHPFSTFSIGFNQTDIDERHHQTTVAQHIRSRHYQQVFDWQEICARLSQAVLTAESPLKESYNTCSLALSEMVHQHGVKGVLTGEGADELFAGYVGYRLDQHDRLNADSADLELLLEQKARKKLWGDSNFFYEKNYHEFQELKQCFYSDEVNNALKINNAVSSPLIDHGKIKDRHSIHQRSYVDFKLRIADHLLADHGDRVVFANSIEARYPFLDKDLIHFIRKIPPQLMIKNGTEKYLLKKVAEKYLPPSVINRNKFSFVAPGSPYIVNNNPDWVMDLLSRETIKKQGLFNPDTIEHLTNQYLQKDVTVNQTFETDFLMIAITTGLFLDAFT